MAGVGLDPLVFDTGVREEERQLEVTKLVEPLGIVLLHGAARDDDQVVAQSPRIQIFEHRERVGPDLRQERVSGAVEELERRGVRLEVGMGHQLLDGLSVAHDGPRLALVPEAVGVADAEGAVQWAALDVVQAEARLAVLHHFAGARGQLVYLVLAQERYMRAQGQSSPQVTEGAVSVAV